MSTPKPETPREESPPTYATNPFMMSDEELDQSLTEIPETPGSGLLAGVLHDSLSPEERALWDTHYAHTNEAKHALAVHHKTPSDLDALLSRGGALLKELPPLPDDLLASGEASKSTDNIPKQTPPQRSLIQRLLAHWTTLSLPVVAAAAWMFMIYQPKQPSYTELPPPTAKNKGTKTPEKRASHEISFTLKIEHGPMLSMDENEYLLRKLIRARFQYTSTFKKSLYTVVFMSDEKGLLTRLYPGTEEGVLKLKSSDYANLKRFVTIAPGTGPER
ncbi:MAG TPA: hypothetical protein DCE42_12225, partial [Myxococcales bacterium]|nr:hypothetical protein [Myxococcales bacterium]